MEEAKSLIEQLTAQLKSETLKETLGWTVQKLRDAEITHRTRMEATQDSIGQVKRKNQQIESEVERLQLLQKRNATLFGKKNTERIRDSRRIIELEQENEELENAVVELTEKIRRAEEETRVLGFPTADELYYEIVRGFGIDFVEKEGKLSARIKNVSKNDIFTVECDPQQIQSVCERIWGFIEF